MSDLEIDGQGPVLTLVGRLTGSTTPQLEQWMAEHAPAPRVWDLSRLVFISSAGLRVMMRHEKQLRQQGGSTLLVGVLPAVHEVFRITGLATFWPQADVLPPAAVADAPGTWSAGSAVTPMSVPVTVAHTVAGVCFRVEQTSATPGTIRQWDAAYLLPLFEWTLPIVLFGNQSRRVRALSTYVAALQLEQLERLRLR